MTATQKLIGSDCYTAVVHNQGKFPLVKKLGNFGMSGGNFILVGNLKLSVDMTMWYLPVTAKLYCSLLCDFMSVSATKTCS